MFARPMACGCRRPWGRPPLMITWEARGRGLNSRQNQASDCRQAAKARGRRRYGLTGFVTRPDHSTPPTRFRERHRPSVAAMLILREKVSSMTEWPSYKRACDLAGAVFPLSEAVILQLARKHGVGRKAGRCVLFSIDDVRRLYEVLPCPSGSFVDPNRRTGSCAAPSAESDLRKVLELMTNTPRKKSARSVKLKSSPNPSTEDALPQRSRLLH